jgi:ribosomal protein S18 acetylase RimI-like enzyme
MIVKRKQYREIQYTKEAVEKYKSPDNLLRHAKIGPDVEGVMFVSKNRNDLIGYCAWKGDYIVALEVLSKYREKGFGEKLIRTAIKSGCKKLSVSRNNQAAINLYTKVGFKANNTNLGPKQIEMEYGN